LGFESGSPSFTKRKSEQLPRGVWESVAKKARIDNGQGGSKRSDQLERIIGSNAKKQAWEEAEAWYRNRHNNDGSDSSSDDPNGNGDDGGSDNDGEIDKEDFFIRNIPVRLSAIVRDDLDSMQFVKCLDELRSKVSAVVAAVAEVIGTIFYLVERVSQLSFRYIVSHLVPLFRSVKERWHKIDSHPLMFAISSPTSAIPKQLS
jgi:hypothetical protein